MQERSIKRHLLEDGGHHKHVTNRQTVAQLQSIHHVEYHLLHRLPGSMGIINEDVPGRQFQNRFQATNIMKNRQQCMFQLLEMLVVRQLIRQVTP